MTSWALPKAPDGEFEFLRGLRHRMCDQGANGIGHLTGLTDQAGAASYGYDSLGRMASEQRTIGTVSKSMAYSYNLDSSVKTLTYPSNAVITYTPDAAGRMLSAVDGATNINYVTSATYGPDNALTGFISGRSAVFAGISSTRVYNKRTASALPHRSQQYNSDPRRLHDGLGQRAGSWL